MRGDSGTLTRRALLGAGAAGLGALATAGGGLAWARNPYGPFRMGIQSYSLRDFPMRDALRMTRDLGLSDLEGFDGHFTVTDDPAKIGAYRDALKAAGVKMRSFGVVGFGGDKAANRRAFVFAKRMGIGVLTADPSP